MSMPRVAASVIVVLFLIFLGSSLFSAHMELQRRNRDEWMRTAVLEAQQRQTQTLEAIWFKLSATIDLLNETQQQLLQTQERVQATEEKVQQTKEAVDVIQQEVKDERGRSGQPSQP